MKCRSVEEVTTFLSPKEIQNPLKIGFLFSSRDLIVSLKSLERKLLA